jgi:hypothetical protein
MNQHSAGPFCHGALVRQQDLVPRIVAHRGSPDTEERQESGP